MESQKIAVVEVIAGFSLEKPLGGIERFVIELARRVEARQGSGDASEATLAVLQMQLSFTEQPAPSERVLRFDTRLTRARLDAEAERLAARLRPR